jgi:trehalose 6-phosphate phosphatase
VVAVDLFERLRDEPDRAAILLDVDGTLAPIVERPEDALVPDETRAELERLASRYALVACVSGRTSADAAATVGVETVVYVGTHGLELEPKAERWAAAVHEFAAGVAWPPEDKGLTVAFHYRGALDEDAARAELEEVAAAARRAGLHARFGRKVLELLPPVEANKGTAIRRLLADRGLRRALYAGDDTTDLDAFRALDGLELPVRIAVASREGPPDLCAAADIVVANPAELLMILRGL